ncbi:MAG: flavodoxin family protein BilS [Beduini sp.]|uniref:flavodoxin family protein BilS n=1 Tax=Beduini sp. TaxID=1922300 RepID=UPI0011CA2D30
MNYAIYYNSVTGNTKILADHIHSQMKENCLYSGNADDPKIEGADLVFVGFWTDKGRCSDPVIELLKKIKHKKIFLFGTAGFGGSPEYFERILSNVEKYVDPTCEVVGRYMCQGKMPMSVRERYQKMYDSDPQNEQFQSLLNNFDQAKKHPNQEDLDTLTIQLKSMIKAIQKS